MAQLIRTYSVRGLTAAIPLQLEGNPGVGDRTVERWFDKIEQTLDILPPAHVAALAATPEGHIWVGSNPRSGGGSLPVGGRTASGAVAPNTPFVHLSYEAMNGAIRVSAPSFTLLHEMGHQADCWEENRRVPGARRSVDYARERDPLGTLCMLWRYHGGRTGFPGEHYADVYADYFRNEVEGHPWGQIRRCRPCPRCSGWHSALSASLGIGRSSFPGSMNQMISWRYDALFRTPPFAGLSRQGTHRESRPVPHADASMIPAGRSSRVPAEGPLHNRRLVGLA